MEYHHSEPGATVEPTDGRAMGDGHRLRQNRRNYYRTLYVQVDAPMAVIKAAYRTIMSRLRMHPDLGGSHEHASWINEAYGVLSDPALRAEYDRRLRAHSRPDFLREHTAGLGAAPVGGVPPTGAHARRAAAAAAAYAAFSPPELRAAHTPSSGARHVCAFCNHSNPMSGLEISVCVRCGAPLAAVRAPAFQPFGISGHNRRVSMRRPRQHEAVAYWGTPPRRHVVHWKDASAHGISLWLPQALAEGERLFLIDRDIHAVAQSVACEYQAGRWLLHAKMLTLQPLKRSTQTEAA